MTVLVTLALVCAVALVFLWLGQRAVSQVLDRRPPALSTFPPVSILKPLKGEDDGLYANLASFAQLDYPRFEILFGIASADDPAIAVAERVRRDHPQVAISIVVCPPSRALNPKVSTLEQLSMRARFDMQLISDSNVRVSPSYLRDLACETADPRVALVTSPVVGVGERTGSALFENLHLASYVARATMAALVYGNRACVIGKSMLFRASHLALVGGWRPFHDVLAEDYLIGNAFERAGFRVALSPHPVATVNRSWTLERFVNRHLRWGQMRRRISIFAWAVELLQNPIPLFVALAVLAPILDEAHAPAWGAGAALAIAVKVAADLALMRRMGRSVPAGLAPLGIIAKDLLIGALWMVAAFRRTIDWRGNVMLMGAGTRLLPLSHRRIVRPGGRAGVGQEMVA